MLTELKFQLRPYGHLMNPDKICFFSMQENLIGIVLLSLGQLGGDTDPIEVFTCMYKVSEFLKWDMVI